MTCDQFRQMDDSEARPISETEFVAMLKHLGECESCRRMVDEYHNSLTPEQQQQAQAQWDEFQPRVLKRFLTDPEA